MAILAAGKAIAIDTPDALRSRIGGDVVSLTPQDEQAAQHDALATELQSHLNGDASALAVVDGTIRFEHPRGAEAVADVASHFRGRFRSISVRRASLEDVFIHLTGSTFDDAPHA